MSASTKSPVRFVVLSWAALISLAGCGSIVSVDQYALPKFWIPRLLITTLLGPLPLTFALSGVTPDCRIIGALLTFALLVSMVWHFQRPGKLSATAFMIILALWALMGFSVAYVWV